MKGPRHFLRDFTATAVREHLRSEIEATDGSPELTRNEIRAFAGAAVAVSLVLIGSAQASVPESTPLSVGSGTRIETSSVEPSTGFTAASGKIRCAVGLVHRSGLLCAATGASHRQYDGRGVLQLLLTGHVATPAAGSDLLLAIDGNRDGGRRPRLGPGQSWHAGGFGCVNTHNAVTCTRDRHGFTVSPTRYAIF